MMFSVVIPVYNKFPHLERSINSVLNQSYKDFELILVDDASNDGSAEKLKQFKGENIRIISRDYPGPGGYAARNFGIKEARGKWVAFLDADDEWYPCHLEKICQLANDFPEVYLMCSGYQLQNGNHNDENLFYKKQKIKINFQLNLIQYLNCCLLRQSPVWTSAAFIRKSSPIAKELFPENSGANRGGDLHAWLKLMCYHKQMAWSSHLGAIYHRDSVNMVTKSAAVNTALFTKEIYHDLVQNLCKVEEILLQKYLTQRLRGISMSSRGYFSKINLCKTLFWKSNLVNSIVSTFSILFILPVRKMISTAIRSNFKF